MKVRDFPGYWYIDGLATGEFAVYGPLLKHVRTHLGDVPFGQLDGPLYICITDTPEFQFAGQAWASTGTWHYRASTGTRLDPRIAHGNYGCIFDRAGVLRFIPPAPNQTSQGFRYVDPVGPGGVMGEGLWLGDETVLKNGVHSYTDIGADILIGQGHVEGGVVVWDGRMRRMLHPGECYSVRVHRTGDLVSVCFYEVGRDGHVAYFYILSVAELLALPPSNRIPGPVVFEVPPEAPSAPPVSVVASPPRHSPGESMQAERGGLVGPAGKFARGDAKKVGLMGPGTFAVTIDADAPVGDAEFELRERPDGRFEVRHLASGAFLEMDATQYSRGLDQQYYLKPAAQSDGYAVMQAEQMADGTVLVFHKFDDPRTYTGAALVWVKK